MVEKLLKGMKTALLDLEVYGKVHQGQLVKIEYFNFKIQVERLCWYGHCISTSSKYKHSEVDVRIVMGYWIIVLIVSGVKNENNDIHLNEMEFNSFDFLKLKSKEIFPL